MARALALGLALAAGLQVAAARDLLATSSQRHLLQSQCATISNYSTSAPVTGLYCYGSACGSICEGNGGVRLKCRYGGLLCAVRSPLLSALSRR